MPEPLDILQLWMQAVITDPQGVESGSRNDEARAALGAELEQVFLPSHELTSAERVGVYAEMYFLRLVEVLVDEFPGLVALLGREEAERLFRDYVCAHPSRHFSLNRLG